MPIFIIPITSQWKLSCNRDLTDTCKPNRNQNRTESESGEESKGDYKNVSWVWGVDREIRPRVTVWRRVMPNNDLEGRIFLSASNGHDRFFFLHTFWSPAFDFNIGVAINESHSYTLTSVILKIDVVCDVAITSTPNVLTIELRDLLYNHCIDNTCCYSFFILPTGRIRVCKISFVSTGENRGKPCLVCKKSISFNH